MGTGSGTGTWHGVRPGGIGQPAMQQPGMQGGHIIGGAGAITCGGIGHIIGHWAGMLGQHIGTEMNC